MGIDITIGGTPKWNTSDYSVAEDATPIDPSDTSGGTSQFTVELPDDDDTKFARKKTIVLSDGSQGTTTGTARELGGNHMTATITADSRLALLNVTRTAQPYNGTLGGAFAYYLGLVGITTGIVVDDTITGRSVITPGWNGSVWEQVKKLCAAEQVEVSLVSNNIVMRPLRGRIAQNYRNSASQWSVSDTNIAQSVEVYYYQSEYKPLALAYPLGSAVPDAYQVDAGAVVTFDISLEPTDDSPLGASLTSIQQPTCVASVAKDFATSSVYTVSGNDGLPITPAQWIADGGRVTVAVNEDTRSITVTIQGANSTEYAPYTIGMSSGDNTFYSSLRLVGAGVFYNRQKATFTTGNTPDDAPTVIGATVDNEFITTYEDAFHAGMWTLARWTGPQQTINVSTTGINRQGDTGSAAYMTMGQANNDPDFKGAGTTTKTTRTNTLTNPGFEKASGAQVVVRKQLLKNPAPTSAPATGWSVGGVASVESGGWVINTPPGTSTPYIFTDTAGEAIVTGDVITATISIRNDSSLISYVRFTPHSRSANTYFLGTNAVAVPQGQEVTATLQWTATVDMAANDLDIAVVPSNSVGTIVNPGAAPFRVRKPLLIRGGDARGYFDGSTVKANTVARTNVSTNPNGAGTVGFSPNNSAIHAITKNVAISGHPQGITTAVKAGFAPGHAASASLTSIYNMDATGVTNPARYHGAWVNPSLAGMKAYWFADGVAKAVPIPANTWTFLASAAQVAANSFASFAVQTIDGSTITDDNAYVLITGVTALTDAPPTESIWGGRPASGGYTYAWAGTVNASASLQSYGSSFDYAYAWLGTAGASMSTESGPAAATVSTYAGAVATQSGAWVAGGSNSLRIVAAGTGGASNAAAYIPVTITSGKTYTILATARLEAPLTGTNEAYSRRLRLPTAPTLLSPAVPNAAGVYPVVWTFTATATYTTLQLWHGGLPGSPDIWWDNILIIEGAYDGGYFDGDTPAVDNKTYAWSGAVSASTSVETTTTVTGKTMGTINAAFAGLTMAQFTALQLAKVRNDFVNQAFGNVAGARVFDDGSWYRIRTVSSITPESINYSAEQDNTLSDANAMYAGMTMAQINALHAGKTNGNFNTRPLAR